MKSELSLVGLACAFIMADLVEDLHRHPLTENAEFEAHRRGSILLGELWRTQRYRVRSKQRVERAVAEVAASRGDARARAELELYRAQASARTWRARARKAQQAWDAWRAEAPEAHALYQEIRHERYRTRANPRQAMRADSLDRTVGRFVGSLNAQEQDLLKSRFGIGKKKGGGE